MLVMGGNGDLSYRVNGIVRIVMAGKFVYKFPWERIQGEYSQQHYSKKPMPRLFVHGAKIGKATLFATMLHKN